MGSSFAGALSLIGLQLQLEVWQPNSTASSRDLLQPRQSDLSGLPLVDVLTVNMASNALRLTYSEDLGLSFDNHISSTKELAIVSLPCTGQRWTSNAQKLVIQEKNVAHTHFIMA